MQIIENIMIVCMAIAFWAAVLITAVSQVPMTKGTLLACKLAQSEMLKEIECDAYNRTKRS